MKTDDLDYAGEFDAAMRRGAPRGTIVSLFVFASFFICLLAWANWAKLDEVTRGEGKFIPSSKTQLLQSLEGGIVKELLVRAGDTVRKGDVLVKIDDTSFASNQGELRAKQIALTAQVTRLRHEASGDLASQPSFDAILERNAKDVITNERALYFARLDSLKTQVEILSERMQQRQRELQESDAALARFTDNLRLANEELKIKKPMADRGIVSKTDIIRLRRDIADSSGQIAIQNQTKPKIEASVREAQAAIREQEQKFRQEAHGQLTTQEAELAVVNETLRGATDRVVRAEIRSPVDGTINKVNSNTVGGVVQAGQILMEIVPLEDSLLVEVKIRPSDIAFVHPRQKALVKITAYDFSVYGGLEGDVELISADSVYDENAKENYYVITVRTLANRLKRGKEDLPIIPGMVASVDILTGKKSVLEYLLKPINKAKNEALTER
jgi:membrane fusion protein, adhesin transport system